jgi:hypothetical protein
MYSIELLFLIIIFFHIRFRRQLVKLIDFCLQMADPNTSNDEKQLIELKLVSLLHAIALRMYTLIPTRIFFQ